MKNMITKTFVQTYDLDMEGRHGYWNDTKLTYEDAVKGMDGWRNAVRVVVKTFDPETFEITVTEVKRTEKVYTGWTWTGETTETTKYAG